MTAVTAHKTKPYKGVAMEGLLAAWYARNTASPGNLDAFRELATRLASDRRAGEALLEIAPGPGYLAIELARLGLRPITGLDVSHSFVRIAQGNAKRAGVVVDFRQGDASALPFEDRVFETVVCRAAFKNFSDPVGALCEMHRVLRPGGGALIIDMRSDATNSVIRQEVAKMGLGRLSAFITRAALASLRKRAYSGADFERMLAATPFGTGRIEAQPLGFEVRLTRAA